MSATGRGPHPLAAHLAASWQAALAGPDPHTAMESFHRGLAAYQNHPWQRMLAEPVVLARVGSCRLLDYGPLDGAPLLVIPSLVNPAWVLDLEESSSLLRWLSARGIRPLLVDWETPSPEESAFTLDDYVSKRLLPLVDGLPAPMDLLGYCLGGTLAVAVAALRPQAIRRVALIAAPWDLRGYPPEQRERLVQLWRQWEPVCTALGAMPMELLQLLFLALDPALTLNKFIRFAGLPPHSEAAHSFIALEDWANAGPPLSLGAARQMLGEWYVHGGPALGWKIDGREITLPQQPSWLAVSRHDRIVPAAAVHPLAHGAPHCHVHETDAGHVGMVVGSRRETQLWQPLLAFLA